MKRVAAVALLLSAMMFTGCASVRPEMPWQNPSYEKDIPATTADSRAEERAKGGWTLFVRHSDNRKQWVTENEVDYLVIGGKN